MVDSYMLKGVEATYAHHKLIIRPFGTWNKILQRANSESDLRAGAKQDLNELLLELPEIFRNR